MMGGTAPGSTGAKLTGIVAFAIGLSLAGSSSAGDWRLSAGMGVQESFTDNVDLATGENAERNSELITTITPSVSLRGSGGRTSMGLDYSLSQLLHRQDPTKDTQNNNLAATGQIEVWDRVAFIEAQASVARQIVNNEDASSESIAGANVNRTETRTVNVTPVFRHHFGTWVETESRATFSKVDVATDELSSTRTIREQLRINSGRRFSVFRWAGDFLSEKVMNDGDEPATRTRRANGNLTYVLSQQISLLANLGWESVEDSSLTEEPGGMTWSAGFQARPSRKTSFSFTYGLENDTQTIDFNASHRLSERTSLTASFNESLQTSQNQIAQDLSFLIVDPVTGQLINSQTGEVFDGSSSNLGLQEETFREESFQLTLSGSRRLLSFSADVFWNRRKTESTSVSESSYGANIDLNKPLNPRLSSSLGLGYEFTDFGTDDQRTQTQTSLNARLSYQLASDISLSFSYILTMRRVNNADEDLTENSVTVGLSKRF